MTILRRITFLAISLFVIAGAFTPAASANSDEQYPNPSHSGTSNSTTPDGQLAGITLYVTNAQPNTSVRFTVFGCDGQAVMTETKSGADNFEVPVEAYFKRFEFGPTVAYEAVYSAPGFSPASVTHSFPHPNPSVGRANCAGDNTPDEPSNPETPVVKTPSARTLVNGWSHKVGKARLARVVRVTPTRVDAGARVRYAVKVNGRTVKQGRVVKVKRSMRGDKLAIVATVSKAGYKPVTRTFKFGKVKAKGRR